MDEGQRMFKIVRWFFTVLMVLCIIGLSYQSCHAQQKYQWKKQIAPAILVFASGASDGLNQALQFRYDRFKSAFPKANDQWYNPSISWANKYKNGDPSQGAKFFGSTSFLVGTTDAYHATRTISNAFNAAAIVVNINDGKKKWWVYAVEILGYWGINRVGFSLVYNAF